MLSPKNNGKFRLLVTTVISICYKALLWNLSIGTSRGASATGQYKLDWAQQIHVSVDLSNEKSLIYISTIPNFFFPKLDDYYSIRKTMLNTQDSLMAASPKGLYNERHTTQNLFLVSCAYWNNTSSSITEGSVFL